MEMAWPHDMQKLPKAGLGLAGQVSPAFLPPASRSSSPESGFVLLTRAASLSCLSICSSAYTASHSPLWSGKLLLIPQNSLEASPPCWGLLRTPATHHTPPQQGSSALLPTTWATYLYSWLWSLSKRQLLRRPECDTHPCIPSTWSFKTAAPLAAC